MTGRRILVSRGEAAASREEAWNRFSAWAAKHRGLTATYIVIVSLSVVRSCVRAITNGLNERWEWFAVSVLGGILGALSVYLVLKIRRGDPYPRRRPPVA
jgi:hypothetical protein